MPAVNQVATAKHVKPKDLLFVELRDSLGEIVPVDVQEVSVGKYAVKYTPKNIGVITVHMAIDGQSLKQSGTRVRPFPYPLFSRCSLERLNFNPSPRHL